MEPVAERQGELAGILSEPLRRKAAAAGWRGQAPGDPGGACELPDPDGRGFNLLVDPVWSQPRLALLLRRTQARQRCRASPSRTCLRIERRARQRTIITTTSMPKPCAAWQKCCTARASSRRSATTRSCGQLLRSSKGEMLPMTGGDAVAAGADALTVHRSRAQHWSARGVFDPLSGAVGGRWCSRAPAGSGHSMSANRLQRGRQLRSRHPGGSTGLAAARHPALSAPTSPAGS